MNGTTLLGHSVLAPGRDGTLAAGGAIDGAVNAPAGRNAAHRLDHRLERQPGQPRSRSPRTTRA